MAGSKSLSLDKYQEVAKVAVSDPEGAWQVVGKWLTEDPNDVRALVTASFIMRKVHSLPQAYHFAKAATQLAPHEPVGWTNLGHVASQMWLADEAEAAYEAGLRVARFPSHRTSLLINLSALYIDNGRFDEALTIVEKVLKDNPDNRNALSNQGFCQLALRDWGGWKGYRNTIGSDWRQKVQYGDEPEWDGSPGKTVALYEDQGIGDAISFASMIPDAIDISQKVIVDCDPRLEHLFRRSFPKAKIYGTRASKEGQWHKDDWKIDCSLPLGQIGEYFRTSDASFPGTAYLTPCPDRVKMWKGLFATKQKPCIGIAWTGGTPRTNSRNRQIALKDLQLVFEAIDAHWVSLQYKDAAKEIQGFPVTQYAYGTLTKDYDDTAALIASLDYVLCVQTAVAHTAGALGIPVSVLVPQATQWRYGQSHDTIPWYQSLKVIKQEQSGSWSVEIERAIATIQSHFGIVSSRATEAPRNDELRRRVHRLCASGQSDSQPDGSHASLGLRVRA